MQEGGAPPHRTRSRCCPSPGQPWGSEREGPIPSPRTSLRCRGGRAWGARVSVALRRPPLAPSPLCQGGGGSLPGLGRGGGQRGGQGRCAPRSRGRGGFVPHRVTDFEVLELELNEQ